jgi:hypothetical protein
VLAINIVLRISFPINHPIPLPLSLLILLLPSSSSSSRDSAAYASPFGSDPIAVFSLLIV